MGLNLLARWVRCLRLFRVVVDLVVVGLNCGCLFGFLCYWCIVALGVWLPAV